MGAAPDIALPWTLFSTGVRALDAGTVGISVFLLVSIRVGDRRVRAAGSCLPEAENLKRGGRQGNIHAALPAVRRRCNASAAYRPRYIEGRFRAAGCRTKLYDYCWPFGPVDEAVVGFWSVMFDSNLMSTRRFFARPAAVLSLATC